jgi:hypothetical protein
MVDIIGRVLQSANNHLEYFSSLGVIFCPIVFVLAGFVDVQRPDLSLDRVARAG